MTTEAARAALERRQEQPTLLGLIERETPAVEKALTQTGVDVERFKRLCWTEIRRQPLLLECTPASVIGAMLLCAQLGLEPGPLGHAYLVPFRKECTFILGYKGMIDLARRSDRLGSIKAEIVHAGDEFDYYETERGPRLRHRKGPLAERGERTHVYCRWTTRVGPRILAPDVVVLEPQQVEAARKRSPAAQKGSGPWFTDEDAMWRKTAVRRAAPFLPLTPHFAQGLDADERAVLSFDTSGEIELEAEAEPTAEGTES